jgi:hypothetical protein
MVGSPPPNVVLPTRKYNHVSGPIVGFTGARTDPQATRSAA